MSAQNRTCIHIQDLIFSDLREKTVATATFKSDPVLS